MSYTDPFGGGTIQPANVSYRSLALTASIALIWPSFAEQSENFAAQVIDILSATGPGLTIDLPDARQVSVGESITFINYATESVGIRDAAGVPIATIPASSGMGVPGENAYFIYLVDNDTEAGEWRYTLFGSAPGALDAALLAGSGLRASGLQLELNSPVITTSSNFTASETQRAQTVVWDGGVGGIALPVSSALSDGYFFYIRNQGTGALTLTADGTELVDGEATVTLNIQESCIVFAGGGRWYTVGRGRNQQFNFTLLIKNVTGGTVVLTPTEAANVVQRYTGVLTSNCEITLPSVVQVYYVSNQTSGAFTLTFRTAGVGTQISIPSGQNAVLFCDGLNVINNSTTVSGLTSLLLSSGTVTTPSIAYSGDSSTGIFRPASSSVSFTGGGSEVLRAVGVASGVNYVVVTSAIATAAPSIAVAGPDTNINIMLDPKGSARVSVGSLGAAMPLGVVATPGLSFTGDANTGLYSPGADLAAIAAGGVEAVRWNATGQSLFPAGTLALPAVAFAADPNTGFYAAAADVVAVAAGGVEAARWNASGQNLVANGTALLPALSFAADPNTGVYRIGADQLGISTNGVLRLSVADALIESAVAHRFAAGAAATPSLAFSADPNTGFYSVGADLLGASAGGVLGFVVGIATAYFPSTHNLGIGAENTEGLAVQLRSTGGSTLAADISAGRANVFLVNATGTPGDGVLGGSIGFSAVGSGRRKAMIASYQDGAGQAPTGLNFYINGSGSITAEALTLALQLKASGEAEVPVDAPHTAVRAVGTRGSEVVVRNATASFGLTDSGKTITKTNTTAYTWTIDPDATTSFPIGAIIPLLHDSTAGDITIARGAGVTLVNGVTNANQTITAGSSASIQKISANRWRYRS